MKNADYWINHLQLEPHPEGGYFKEVYRSDESLAKEALPDRFHSARAYATSIYFLLTSAESSAFHCLQSDELWYYHAGSPVTIHALADDYGYKTTLLGPDPLQDHHFSALMRSGTWFGATVDEHDAFSLVSCVVTPGFDFNDFELGSRSQLTKEFPLYESIIEKLTKK